MAMCLTQTALGAGNYFALAVPEAGARCWT
jgi:hypothetical protein